MIPAELVEEIASALSADVDVEQNDVDLPVGELRARLSERPGLPHRAALGLEVDTAQETDRGVVIDDQNGVAGRVHAAPQCMRNPIRGSVVYSLKMTNEHHSEEASEREAERVPGRVPRPSPQFRRRSWLLFQRALDPLAPPKPLKGRRQR
jgi:hypothetical protein